MQVVNTTHVNWTLDARPFTDGDALKLVVINEQTNGKSVYTLGTYTYEFNKVSFTQDISLVNEGEYLLILKKDTNVSGIGGEVLHREKVICTTQDVQDYDYEEGEYTTAASGDNEYEVLS